MNMSQNIARKKDVMTHRGLLWLENLIADQVFSVDKRRSGDLKPILHLQDWHENINTKKINIFLKMSRIEDPIDPEGPHKPSTHYAPRNIGQGIPHRK